MKVTTSLSAIQDLLPGWQNAIRNRDLPAIMAHYSDDLIAYDAIMALQFRGKAAYQEHYQKCFDMCPAGQMQWELRDLEIEAGSELAFCHALLMCGVVDDAGTCHGGWMRWTGCLRLTDKGWKFVHEHFSSPFDPMSGKVMGDLQP